MKKHKGGIVKDLKILHEHDNTHYTPTDVRRMVEVMTKAIKQTGMTLKELARKLNEREDNDTDEKGLHHSDLQKRGQGGPAPEQD